MGHDQPIALTDEVLLQRIGAGDKAAMKAFYERHENALYRFIRTRLRDPHEAADALQDCMLAVWNDAGRKALPKNPRAWLFAIARNKAVDRVRKVQRDIPTEPDESIPDGALNPEQLVAVSQDASRVRRCLERLGAAHRAVLQLAFFQELSYTDIAEAEGIPHGTVKTRVHHAKRLMARCLGALST